MIEKQQLNETDLIIRDRWPDEYNEDIYLEEAAKQHTTAGRAEDAAVAAGSSEAYTAEEFKGLAGSAVEEAVRQRKEKHNTSRDRHKSVGDLMESAARNILRTKLDMNDAQISYHEKFQEAMSRAVSEGWPQKHLNDVKHELVERYQGEVDRAAEEFTREHSQIVGNIKGLVQT